MGCVCLLGEKLEETALVPGADSQLVGVCGVLGSQNSLKGPVLEGDGLLV